MKRNVTLHKLLFYVRGMVSYTMKYHNNMATKFQNSWFSILQLILEEIQESISAVQ
uniref:Uncharacterized protein n=1 Tax=Onchocerca volvulus TaxID=6282 RepID=A0A8R1TSV7_ONCVO